MPPTLAILSPASTTPHLTTRREWPFEGLPLPRELSSDEITPSSSSSSPSSSLSSSSASASSQNGTNTIALILIILALLSLIISFVAAGLSHRSTTLRLNQQKISTAAKHIDVAFELQDHHRDSESEAAVDDEEKEKEEEEHEEELHIPEQKDYHPTSNKYQIKLCIAQTVRVYPPGSASMIDIRNNSPDPWYRIDDSIPSSKSVRDVSTLPDLSSARAILSSHRHRRRSDDDDGMICGRRGREMDAKVGMEGLAIDTTQHEAVEKQKQMQKKNKKTKKWEPPTTMRMRPMPDEEEEARGLRRALKKRISTPRFNFQGGGMRELVRSIGF